MIYAQLSMGQKTFENVNKEQEIYRRINNSKDPSRTHELLQDLNNIQTDNQVQKQRASIKLTQSLLEDIRYNQEKIDEFARNNDDNLSFEQVDIINQLLIQNRHNKTQVLNLDKF